MGSLAGAVERFKDCNVAVECIDLSNRYVSFDTHGAIWESPFTDDELEQAALMVSAAASVSYEYESPAQLSDIELGLDRMRTNSANEEHQRCGLR